MENPIGQTLGKYTLVKRIGQGGMAEVYKAHQAELDRFVVVKVLHRHLADDAEHLARIEREMRVLARLQHPHIIRVIDAGIDDGRPFLVMDYVRGGTVGTFRTQNQRVPIEQALSIAAQIASALGYSHRQGVLHRDVKPSNILLDDSLAGHVLLADFGLAQRMEDPADPITLAGAMVGTPTYMSPEAIRGEACDVRSDLYSLGVVLYELVTGTPPYLANTPYSMMQKLASEPLPLPSTVNPSIPASLEQLLLRALDKDPGQRFADATAMRDAIRSVEAEMMCRPVELLTPTAEGDAAQRAFSGGANGSLPQSRNWRALLGAMAGVGVVAAATVWLLVLGFM